MGQQPAGKAGSTSEEEAFAGLSHAADMLTKWTPADRHLDRQDFPLQAYPITRAPVERIHHDNRPASRFSL